MSHGPPPRPRWIVAGLALLVLTIGSIHLSSTGAWPRIAFASGATLAVEIRAGATCGGAVVNPAIVPADGSGDFTACATLLEEDGAPIPNRPVVFTTSLGTVSTGTAKSATSLTNAQGVAAMRYRGGGTAATDTLIAAISALNLVATRNVWMATSGSPTPPATPTPTATATAERSAGEPRLDQPEVRRGPRLLRRRDVARDRARRRYRRLHTLCHDDGCE